MPSHRYRRVAWNLFVSVLGRALAMVALILSFRAGLPHLGEERFGIWMTIAGLAMLLAVCDLGVGAASIGAVAEANARGEPEAVRAVAKDAVVLLIWLGLLAGTLVGFVGLVMPVERLLPGASPEVRQETRDSLLVLAGLLAISLPSQGVMRLCEGLQRGWVAHGVGAACSLLTILSVGRLSSLDAGIPAYLLVTYGVQQLPGVLIGLAVASIGDEWRKPPSRSLGVARARTELLGRGRAFVPLQMAGGIGIAASGLIVSLRLGPAHVADLAVVQRIFALVSLPLMLVQASLWPVYADAHARGDMRVLRRTFGYASIATGLLAALGSLAIVTAFPWLETLFAAGKLTLPFGLVIAFCVWTTVEAVGVAVSTSLNGRNVLRPQVAMALGFVTLSLTGMVLLVGPVGVAGVPIALTLAYLLSTALPLSTRFRHVCVPRYRTPATTSAASES